MRLNFFLTYVLFTATNSISAVALAANSYCIDPDMDPTFATAAGCDSSSGLFSSITNFDGSGIVLNGGDKVLLKRGVVYREQIVVPASGLPLNPITYDAYGDTALPRPTIARTDLYDGWWLNVNGLIHNASMEKYSKTTVGTKDDFVHWGEVTIGCSLTADSTIKRGGNTSMKMVCDPAPTGDLAKATANITDLKPGTGYTLTAHAMSLDAAGPNMSIILKYHQADGSLKYPHNGQWVDYANNTQLDWSGGPDIWIEKTVNLPPTITDTNGNSGWFEILFFSRGTYPTWLDDASLTETGVNHPKIWVGTLPGVRYSYGAIVNGQRLPVVSTALGTIYPPEFNEYYNYFESDRTNDLSTYNVSDIKENRFYTQSNGSLAYTTSPYFYIRNDSGHPGPIEVAARKYAFLVSDKSWISINNIDVEGPGARPRQGDDDGRNGSLISIKKLSSHIDVNNVEASLSYKIGIGSEDDTSEIHYNNVDVHDNGSTGIYNSASYGSVKNSQSHHNGNVLYDWVRSIKQDDVGGIGTNGNNIIISGNTVYHNGPDGGADIPAGYQERENADFEISAYDAPDTTIEYNHVYDCIQGCIQLAKSPDSEVQYNIIDGFGSITNPAAPSTYGGWSGIRIGSPSSYDGSANVRIFNNIITGGRVTHVNRHASIMFSCGNNSGAEIRNNIIFDNTAWHIYITDPNDPYSKCNNGDASLNNNGNIAFSNNLYEEYNSNYIWREWVLRDETATDIEQWKTLTDSTEQTGDPLFADLNENDFHISSASSPAVNAGVYVNIDSDYEGKTIVGLPDIGVYEYDTDIDNDAFEGDQFIGGTDCNDNDPTIYPGALEISFDGIDQNCDQGPDASIVATASHITAKGGSVNVEATSVGKQSDTLVVSLTPDASSPLNMSWGTKRGGRWTLTIKNMPSNPGSVYVSGVEGMIKVNVTSK